MNDSCILSFSIIFTTLFILEKTKIITHSISNDFKTPNIAPIILFKPTKAANEQFRPNFSMALSYFLGGDNSFCSEDDGFAMKPWVEVKFENSGFIIENDRAIAMGNYFFTSQDNLTVKVEYTFGYKLRNGKLVIDLHHSSLPFSV